jgi:hypothetical protein
MPPSRAPVSTPFDDFLLMISFDDFLGWFSFSSFRHVPLDNTYTDCDLEPIINPDVRPSDQKKIRIYKSIFYGFQVGYSFLLM